jgi:hypothetical protein
MRQACDGDLRATVQALIVANGRPGRVFGEGDFVNCS